MGQRLGTSKSGRPLAPYPGGAGEGSSCVDRAVGRGPQETCRPVPYSPYTEGETEAQRGQWRNLTNMPALGRGRAGIQTQVT